MAESVRAAVKVGPARTEIREFVLPEIPEDGGWLHVEAAGICGSDVSSYPQPLRGLPEIMGHENVGQVVKLGRVAAQRWGIQEGDRIALEEYLPCGHCEFCFRGDYRLCFGTDHHHTANASRYGHTPIDVAPTLWGGFSQYLYLPPNCKFHRVPSHVSSAEAALALPLGNGWEWAHVEGGVGPGKTILIQGPGQQGQGCVIASKVAGADCIIVAGLTRDARRLEVARLLGADHVIDVEREDLRERIAQITAGRGVDVVVDTAAGNASTVLPALDVLSRKRGTLVIPAGSMNTTIDGFPIGLIKLKFLAVKAARGHSYWSVARALH